MRELFRREAQKCARLIHPNIARLRGHEAPDRSLIVMEYLEGVALSQAVAATRGRQQRLYLHRSRKRCVFTIFTSFAITITRTTQRSPSGRITSGIDLLL